ncbi:MAG: acetyl-CoA carboxylase biotin carboxylase subunit [Candidatus Limnocylindrus sp. ZSMar2m-chloro-G89]|nr:MAG: acetyl-CoA carboxylase biotin carboxylase subunit [Candidatus Limnocylindrus sp.]RLT49031.1 MAG: acetyl-CoA carboxylase biotin carboxylase subunit [Candidatus Limnocylindrus sp. ZSMar2m-chloro-G89]
MIKRVLIANRGEIALRILRACRQLGLEAVVAYSEADADSRAVLVADEAVCIGPADAKQSYLSAPAIISAALATGCDAIHPGYGFLSENAAFAEAVAAHKLTFIGPSAPILEKFHSKAATRALLAKHGLPTIPGSDGVVADESAALDAAKKIGYPVILKASAGGGGRGMRVAQDAAELSKNFSICAQEAQAAFGDGSIYLEKYLSATHHVEVQIAVDSEGTALHFGERDCSLQRRHQKLVEESPSTALTPRVREDFLARAAKAIGAAGYRNVGTLEFLVGPDGKPYFIEINCRIQVEHPVTEVVTGVDLVALQITLASGARMPMTQREIQPRGHAIEFRITAEDPANNFQPQAGEISAYRSPSGPWVRFDSHLYAGYEVPPYYDSLLGKLIVWGATREEAIARSRAALRELEIDGVATTRDFFLGLLESPSFLSGGVTTSMLDDVGTAAILAAAPRRSGDQAGA